MHEAGFSPETEIASGRLRGRLEDGVAVFRGVPYAAAPTGERRFRPPAPAPAWSGVREAVEDGPIAPQPPSRLSLAMGNFTRPQSEDCLSLTIWTPAADRGKRPVIVWIHGGAYMSGAGSLDWYSGAGFAREGDVVAVGVNYRLGPLGFLYLPGVSEGNLGLLDQIAALRWVQENIEAFGGDPDNVTIAGQSAGGHAIAYMMASPAADGLFRRAILQSPPLGLGPIPKDGAAETGKRFLELLGLEPGQAAKLREFAPEALLGATGELAKRTRRFADASPPLQPVADGTVIAGDYMPAIAAGAARGIDVMIGTTREEMNAFFAFDPEIKAADRPALERRAGELLGDAAPDHLDEYERMRPGAAPGALLGDLLTDAMFLRSSLEFAEHRAAHGKPAYVFQFDWQSPMPGLGASHCLELPFIFNNPAAWTDSPMMEGSDPESVAGLGRAMQRAWCAFARSGDPNHDGLPRWRPYAPGTRETMRFDAVTGPQGDLAGLDWRRPWPTRGG